MKTPKDLKVKIGTKSEVEWTGILRKSEELIITGRANLEINEMIVNLAKKHIAEEKEKFK